MTAISEALSDKRVSDERLELMLESIVPANTGGDLNLYNANDARLPFKSDTLTRALRELQSLRSGNGGEVRVKALEWAGDEASTPFGKYRLYRTDDGWGLSFNDEELVHVGFNSVASFESPREKAMSYAQPQYRARILSALDIKP